MSPQDRTAFVVALAGALLLHAGALGALVHQPAPRAIDVPAVAARLVDRAAIDAEGHVDLDPEADLEAEADSRLAAPPDPVATRRPDPRADSVPDDTRPVPARLTLPLRGRGALAYAFVIDGRPGEAALAFRIENGRYELVLDRRAGDRALPRWSSEGRIGPQGLQPERHRVHRGGRERERLIFDRDAARPALRVGGRDFPLSAGTQDRLSWWLQLAAMMASETAPRVGLRLRVPVASAAGVHDWDFEVAARDGDRWLLRREMPRGAGRPVLQWSARLDGGRGFLPVELRFSLDGDEQWALRLLENDDRGGDSDGDDS